MTSSRRHQVIVIGSGFGGLFAVKRLKRADASIVLISRTAHHLLAPEWRDMSWLGTADVFVEKPPQQPRCQQRVTGGHGTDCGG